MAFWKYLSQILLATAGVMSLWWDSHKTTLTGKKRPTLVGWIIIAALASGLILFFVTDRKEREENKKKEASQREQITILKDMYFARTISEVEISFKPTDEHWSRIVEAYKNTNPKVAYADAWMTAERDGKQWKISFDPISRPEGDTQFQPVDTSEPNGRGFDGVIREATIALLIQWGGDVVTELRPATSDGYPPVLAVSQDRISYTLRPKVSLGSLRDNQNIIFRGNSYPASLRIHSLDQGVMFEQTFDLSWTKKDDTSFEARLFPYISGPHRLNIKFKTDPS